MNIFTFYPKWSNLAVVVPFTLSTNFFFLILVLKRFDFSDAFEKFSLVRFFCPYKWLLYLFRHSNNNDDNKLTFNDDKLASNTTSIYRRLVTCWALC